MHRFLRKGVVDLYAGLSRSVKSVNTAPLALRNISIPLDTRWGTNEENALRKLLKKNGRQIETFIKNEEKWNQMLSVCPGWLRIMFKDNKQGVLLAVNSDEGKGSNKDSGREDPNGEGGGQPPFNRSFYIAAILTFIVVWWLTMDDAGTTNADEENSPTSKFVSRESFFNDLLAKGEVDRIVVHKHEKLANIYLHPGAKFKGHVLRSPNELVIYHTVNDSEKFEKELREAEERLQIPVTGRVELTFKEASSATLWIRYISYMGAALLAIYLLRATYRGDGMFNGSSNPFDPTQGAGKLFQSFAPSKIFKPDQKVMFKDVAGLIAAKQEVAEFIQYLKQPEVFSSLGAKLPRGALLLGPPGCGKTLLVKALANEAQVPFFFMAGSEFVEVIGGLGASRMRELFQQARSQSPSIIFIDEIDTIGKKRSGQNASGDGGQSEVEHTLNQLLVEMDGMDTTAGTIVFAATNRHEVLDRALLRPGRFDRHILLDFPSMEERVELFEMYLGKYVLAQLPGDLKNRLASLTPGMTGADIANICNEAALTAARSNKTAVEMVDFDHALERVIAGAAKKSRVLTESERRMVAFHEAGHAVVGWMLKHTDGLLKVSIVPRTNAALGFAQVSPKERLLFSTDELADRTCMLLGGRVAESLIFNRISSGAQDDLRKVTDLAYKQVREWGMSPSVGHLSFDVKQEDMAYGIMPFSKRLQELMDEEAKRMVGVAYRKTEELLKTHRDKLYKVAEALLEREVLSYEDVEALIGPPPFGSKVPIIATTPLPGVAVNDSPVAGTNEKAS